MRHRTASPPLPQHRCRYEECRVHELMVLANILLRGANILHFIYCCTCQMLFWRMGWRSQSVRGCRAWRVWMGMGSSTCCSSRATMSSRATRALRTAATLCRPFRAASSILMSKGGPPTAASPQCPKTSSIEHPSMEWVNVLLGLPSSLACHCQACGSAL